MQLTKLGNTDADLYLSEKGDRTIKMGDGHRTLYRGYVIETKKDFGSHGFLINGHMVTQGYVVTDGGMVNVMPGGTWFQTVIQAMRAIDDLIRAETLEPNPKAEMQMFDEHPFWALNRFRRNAEERAPELALLLQSLLDHIGHDKIKDMPLGQEIVELLDEIDLNCDTRPTQVDVAASTTTKIGPRLTARFSLPARKV